MRLIYADTLKGWIEKYRYLHTLRNNNRLFSKVRKEEIDEVIQSILLAVDAQSTVDAVEVVRCKDCTYWNERETNKKGFVVCKATYMDCTEYDYCSFGERREVQNEID